MFCQDAVDATVCVFVPRDTKAKDVTVSLVPPADDGAGGHGSLVVLLRDVASTAVGAGAGTGAAAASTPFFHRNFAYDVVINRKRTALERLHDSRGRDFGSGDDDDVVVDDLDWELLDFDDRRRIVRCSVKKKPPHGLQVWWTRVFDGDVDAVDVAAIPERLGPGGAPKSALSMKEAWDQAHAQFKANIATQERWKPQYIDVGDSADGGDGSDSD